MPQCVILVDNSNVYIEGMKLSAKRKGVRRKSEFEKDPQDPSWRVDFTQLLSCLADGKQIHAAILVGSRPPQNDKVWDAARHSGFDVITHDRDSNNKEKAVDTELVAQGTEIICTATEKMTLVIASGDRDFLPLVRVAQRRGWHVEMCAFGSAFASNGEMATTVNDVRLLDAYFEKIGKHEFQWPVPEVGE